MRKEFERTSPEAVGIRSQAILDYIDALERSNTEMHGIMIMRHGKICAEGWWQPFAPNLRHGLQSHTKTYAATAVGIAYTEGVLKLDERLIDIFPEESPADPSENLKLLTVRDVLDAVWTRCRAQRWTGSAISCIHRSITSPALLSCTILQALRFWVPLSAKKQGKGFRNI